MEERNGHRRDPQGHDRPDPRLLGDAPELGGLDRRTTRPGATGCSRPRYPGFEVEVEALNADPSPIEALTIPAIVEHLEEVVGGLDAPPILIGHSAGGVFTQILLDHGFGAVRRGDQLRADRGRQGRAPAAGQGDVPGAEEPRQPPQGRRLDPRAVAVRVHEHLQRGARRASSTSATTSRRPAASSGRARSPASSPATRARTSTTRTTTAPPLLFISGSDDHLMPPSVQRSNAKHYKSGHRHRGRGVRGPAPAARPRTGWEEVADYALDWAEAPRGRPTRRERSGSPTSAGRRS